ncbi:MAG: transposase [Gemmatimonadetes bacterium]|nr:transposase [Gemmatimonadota bacterium]
MRRPLLTEAQWAEIAPLLPTPKRSPLGGLPRVSDRACLEGILSVLRTGARWRDLPDEFPVRRRVGADSPNGSDKTCGCRCGGRSSAPSMHGGGSTGVRPSWTARSPRRKGGAGLGKTRKGRGRSSWYWSTARVFLSECTWPRRISRSPRRRNARDSSRAPRGPRPSQAEAKAHHCGPRLRRPRVVGPVEAARHPAHRAAPLLAPRAVSRRTPSATVPTTLDHFSARMRGS